MPYRPHKVTLRSCESSLPQWCFEFGAFALDVGFGTCWWAGTLNPKPQTPNRCPEVSGLGFGVQGLGFRVPGFEVTREKKV